MPRQFLRYRYTKVSTGMLSVEDASTGKHLFYVPGRDDAEKACALLNNTRDQTAITILKATLSGFVSASEDRKVSAGGFKLFVNKESRAALHAASKVGHSA